MTRRSDILNKLPTLVLWGAILAILYVASLYSYHLFHVAVEVFISVVGFSIFMMTYNTRQFSRNGLLNVFGAGFLSVALLNLLHSLAYEGMGLFPEPSTNQAAQFWLATRFIHVFTLLLGLIFINREFKFSRLLVAYGTMTLLLLASIFAGVFPTAYLEGVGLTPFKIVSEYVISAIFLGTIGLFIARRKQLDRKVLFLLVGASAAAVVSEMLFTLYLDVYDLFNLLGHYLYLISFYLVYKAVIETGLRHPYALLFRELKQSEESLRRSEGLLRSVIGNASVILLTTDEQGIITLLDGRELPEVNIQPKEAIGRSVNQVSNLPATHEDVHRALNGETFAADVPLSEGATFYTSYSPLRNDAGRVMGMIAVATDVTERRQAEEMSRRVAQAARVREAEEAERRRLARELHDQVGGNLAALSMSVGVVKRMLSRTVKHINPEEALEALNAELDNSLELVQQTSQSVRAVMTDLRPTALDESGLLAAIRWYGERLGARTGLAVVVQGDDLDPRPEASVETELFRITQEALSNIVKHARASRVAINLEQQGGMLVITIADDGVGFDPQAAPQASERGGWGLGTMGERAEALGGHLQINSQPGQGTQIVVWVPYVAQQNAQVAEPMTKRTVKAS